MSKLHIEIFFLSNPQYIDRTKTCQELDASANTALKIKLNISQLKVRLQRKQGKKFCK